MPNGTPAAGTRGDRADPQAHPAARALSRALALALGSLVRRRGLRERVPRPHHRGARAHASAHGGTGRGSSTGPGLQSQLPAHIQQVEATAAKARSGLRKEEAAREEAHAAADRAFLEAKRSVKFTLPTLTFADSLTLFLGDREIQLRSPGHAITPGDVYLYLPRERALVTGDLLVNPITYALFCYPTGWIAALERLDAFNATWIIPGHGAPMRSEKLLHETHDLLVRERKLALELKASGAASSTRRRKCSSTRR
jgi:hypothetical protein